MSAQPQYVPTTNVFSAATPIAPPNGFVVLSKWRDCVLSASWKFFACKSNLRRQLSQYFLELHSANSRLFTRCTRHVECSLLAWESFGHFISPAVSAILGDKEKLTYLKTLVVGKTKSAIAEYSYSGVLYRNALATLQKNFQQPHAVVGAHLDKWSVFRL